MRFSLLFAERFLSITYPRGYGKRRDFLGFLRSLSQGRRVMAKFIVYKKVQFELQIEVEANNEAEAVELAKESGDWEQLDGNEETYEAVTA